MASACVASPPLNAWGTNKGGDQYTLADVMRAQASEGMGFTAAQKEKAAEKVKSHMTTLRWCARPNKKSRQKPKEASGLEEFVVQKKKSKKCKSPAAAPVNPWNSISAAVYTEPSALHEIMAEQRSRDTSEEGTPEPIVSESSTQPAPSSTEPEASKEVATMPQGVWSLAGWKTDQKIQGVVSLDEVMEAEAKEQRALDALLHKNKENRKPKQPEELIGLKFTEGAAWGAAGTEQPNEQGAVSLEEIINDAQREDAASKVPTADADADAVQTEALKLNKEGDPWKKRQDTEPPKVSLAQVMAAEMAQQPLAAAPPATAGPAPIELPEAALPAEAKANWVRTSAEPAPALEALMHAEGEAARLEADWKAKLAAAWTASAPKTPLEGILAYEEEKEAAAAVQHKAAQAAAVKPNLEVIMAQEILASKPEILASKPEILAAPKSTDTTGGGVTAPCPASPTTLSYVCVDVEGEEAATGGEGGAEGEDWIDCELSPLRAGGGGLVSEGQWDSVECRGNGDLGIFDPRRGWFKIGNEGEWIAVGNKKAGKPRAIRALTNDEKQLFEACEMGDLTVVNDCLDNGADPLALKAEDASRFHGALPVGFFYERLMPLMVACEAGHLPVVQHLVEKARVDPSQATPTGLTPLIAACQSGTKAAHLVKYLVNAGVQPEQADGHGFTALWVACRNGDLSLVRYLIEEAKVDPNHPGDPHRGSGLMAAAAHGHLHLVEYLVGAAGAAVAHKDVFGEDALSSAVAMEQDEVVAYLGGNDRDGGGSACSIM